MTFPVKKAPGRTRLLEQLMAVVRPEFRTEIYVPAPDDPVFIADECAVADCDRTAASTRRVLCNAHAIRFRKRGCPPMADFLADPGAPVAAADRSPPASSTAAATDAAPGTACARSAATGESGRQARPGHLGGA
ncbi:hypothetical protein H1V43_38855 [Streptomyces sp. PSKA54]|uniref:Uncharacterized protein n=1 Tax=Streptomyces himalayensis subsp. aureolus TaxID=2758039 RepID=A0A7W2D9G3_9ACTN|nr:hypothetical protein [Streptomyces himalayensis]MBA4867144.1 hypothetical protein [Streptomyces himalayensis subsp. aureolus]